MRPHTFTTHLLLMALIIITQCAMEIINSLTESSIKKDLHKLILHIHRRSHEPENEAQNEQYIQKEKHRVNGTVIDPLKNSVT